MLTRTDILNQRVATKNYGWAGYFFGRISDIRSIPNAGYPISVRILKKARYPATYRISGNRNQPDIRHLDSFNIGYPDRYLKWPRIRPNPNNNITFKNRNALEHFCHLSCRWNWINLPTIITYYLKYKYFYYSSLYK